MPLSQDNQSRFDSHISYDENTYAQQEEPFVAFDVSSLNGEIVALNTIKDIVYSPTLSFLVAVDNIIVHRLIKLAIEEVRFRWIQYERAFDVDYVDIDNTSSSTKVSETLKAIFKAETIDYGEIVQINNIQYLVYSLPLTLNLTNFGEFANQQKIYLGTDEILDDGNTKMFLLEPDEWHWGTARGTESVMLLPDLATTNVNSREIKSETKNKGFAFVIDLQLDFNDSTIGEFHEWLYKDSILEKHGDPTMKLQVDFYKYNSSSETFVKASSLTMEREMILVQNQPNEKLSKGDKIVFSLVLTPKYN